MPGPVSSDPLRLQSEERKERSRATLKLRVTVCDRVDAGEGEFLNTAISREAAHVRHPLLAPHSHSRSRL